MRVSAGTVDITPSTPLTLGANWYPTTTVSEIHDPLEANAVVFRDGAHCVALVSLDLLYVGQHIREGIVRLLHGVLGSESIFLAATHTHRAPAVDVDKSLLGTPNLEYADEVAAKVAAMLRVLVEDSGADGCSLRIAGGVADHSINRRLRRLVRISREGMRWRRTEMQPNRRGARNEELPVVQVLGEDGNPIAIVWNYACHPTAFPPRTMVSADYPGVVRSRLRRGRPDLPVLFLQGFSGNTRPPSIQSVRGVRSRLTRILRGPQFGDWTQEQYEAWSDSLAELVAQTVDSLATSSPSASYAGALRARRVERPIGEFVLGAADPRRVVSFHRIDIAGVLSVVGISGELVCEYRQSLGRIEPERATIWVGCIDDTFGYAPTRTMLPRGGYEVCGFLESFQLDSVSPEVEQRIYSGVAELVEHHRLEPGSRTPDTSRSRPTRAHEAQQGMNPRG